MISLTLPMSFPDGSAGEKKKKNWPANAGDRRDLGSIPGSGRSPEKSTTTYTIILAWRIPCTKQPGKLQSMELQRVGHD